MALERIRVNTEWHPSGGGAEGLFYLDDAVARMEALLDEWEGRIKLIEIGGRMGGDCIGSALVRLSTGIDFVRAVIEVALGQEPTGLERTVDRAAAVRFVLSGEDLRALERVRREAPELLYEASVRSPDGHEVTDSSARFGYYILHADRPEALLRYMPEDK